MKVLKVDPPVYLLLSITAILLLYFLPTQTRLIAFPWNLAGIIPLAIGVIINLSADRVFKKFVTSVKPLDKTTCLITTGVFKISRHPMYLGFVLILTGIACLTGTATAFVIVILFALFMHLTFIRFEEEKMEETFGEAWLDYKEKVNRWI